VKEETIENAWHFVGMALILTAAICAVTMFLAPKRVDGYYLSHGGGTSAAVCVYAHWTWHVDEMSFCTDDQQKALDFVTKANASIAK
jgi:predicted membrane channel-forming protein YqfA (hemolysin III family)